MVAKSPNNRSVFVIDCDGVVSDFYFSFTQYLHNKHNKPEYPIGTYQAAGWGTESIGLTKEHEKDFWDYTYGTVSGGSFWLNLREMEPGIVSRLFKELTDDVVYFCTTREDTLISSAQSQTHAWLLKHGWPTPNVVVSERKGDFCYSVNADFFLDDKFSNCEQVCQKSPKTKVFWLALPSQREHIEAAKKLNMHIIYHLREFFVKT